MRNTLFQRQANAISHDVIEQIKEENAKMGEEIKITEQKMFNLLKQVAQADSRDKYETPGTSNVREDEDQHLNLASQASMMDYFDKRFKEMEKKLQSKQRNQNNDDEEEPVKEKRKRQNKKPFRYDTSKYCWSCGAGNHTSDKCNKRKKGHQINATFKNMMGGSTAFCQVVPDS